MLAVLTCYYTTNEVMKWAINKQPECNEFILTLWAEEMKWEINRIHENQMCLPEYDYNLHKCRQMSWQGRWSQCVTYGKDNWERKTRRIVKNAVNREGCVKVPSNEEN